MPNQMLTTELCWWQWTDAAWGFASAQTWLLWLLKSPSWVKQASSINNTTGARSGFSLLWCTKHQSRKKVIVGGLVEPAPSADGKDGATACVQHSTLTVWPTAWVLVEGFFSKRCKTSSSNCGVWTDHPHPVLCVFTAKVPVSCKWWLTGKCTKIWTSCVWKTFVINPLRFPAIAIHCTVCQVKVCKFGPGEVLHVDVDLSTVHILVRFWVHPSKPMTPSMLQEVWETVEMWTAHTSLCCVVVGCVLSLVAVHLNICSKPVPFFSLSPPQNTSVVCFISNFSHRDA